MKYCWTSILILLMLVKGTLLGDWPMSAQNPQRTSYSPETVGGLTSTVWYKPIPDLIPSRCHIITSQGVSSSEDKIFVATAKGVYSLNPADGATRWIYTMNLPAGDAPTYSNGVLYICGVDKSIHAINANTGAFIWQTLKAGGAFYCNPVVVNNRVYAGSRDGYFYCFDTIDGSLVWSYPAVGQSPLEPITQSAAYQTYPDYPNGVIFFAAKDNRCYAIRADTGAEIWKSAQFRVDGFSAFWPVVVKDVVIFVAADIYPTNDSDLIISMLKPTMLEGDADVTAHITNGWLDLSNHVDHLTQYPYHKTMFVLDRTNGQEAEVSPIYDTGNPAGNRYPPAIGPDPTGSTDVLVWAFSPWDQGPPGNRYWFTTGRYLGWKMGTADCRTVPDALTGREAGDEPEAHSILNDKLYFNRGGDGFDNGGIFNLSGGGGDTWGDFTFPSGYNQYIVDRKYSNINWSGWHGHQNPPAPLRNRVVFHRSNCVFSLQ